MSTVATKVRIAGAASAIVAAVTFMPVGIAHATPMAPLPTAALGSTLGAEDLDSCDPVDSDCAAEVTAAPTAGGPIIVAGNLAWLGSPANPNFKPLFALAFPSFGLNFEACIMGFGLVLGPYGTGYAGLGLGC